MFIPEADSPGLRQTEKKGEFEEHDDNSLKQSVSHCTEEKVGLAGKNFM